MVHSMEGVRAFASYVHVHLCVCVVPVHLCVYVYTQTRKWQSSVDTKGKG